MTTIADQTVWWGLPLVLTVVGGVAGWFISPADITAPVLLVLAAAQIVGLLVAGRRQLRLHRPVLAAVIAGDFILVILMSLKDATDAPLVAALTAAVLLWVAGCTVQLGRELASLTGHS